jgi:hypothetical protein
MQPYCSGNAGRQYLQRIQARLQDLPSRDGKRGGYSTQASEIDWEIQQSVDASAPGATQLSNTIERSAPGWTDK